MVHPVSPSSLHEACSAQILESYRPDVAAALARAFPGERVDEVAPLTEGRSGGAVLSFRVASKPYVLKQDARAGTPLADSLLRSMTCIRIASDLGVAPKVVLLDETHGISIVEQLTRVPRAQSAEERAARLEPVVRSLRRLHDGPPFPDGPGVPEFEQRVDELLRERDASPRPERLTLPMKEIAALTKRHQRDAPCHRELNPTNVIVTETSAFFVDWDAAGQGDPFFDLAELSVFEPPDPELRARALALYLGRAPSPEESARATLARVQALGFFATAMMYGACLVGRPWSEGATPLPMVEMLAQMGASRSDALLATVVSSLLDEMGRAICGDAYGEAKTLTGAV